MRSVGILDARVVGSIGSLSVSSALSVESERVKLSSERYSCDANNQLFNLNERLDYVPDAQTSSRLRESLRLKLSASLSSSEEAAFIWK